MTYHPYELTGQERTGPWLVICDHASNKVPPVVPGSDLGIATDEMQRHIAWDIGAAGVAQILGNLLNAPVLCSHFSRLVIDANRGLDDPTLIMQLYDGTIIPANRDLSADERNARIAACYAPYHAALAQLAARPGIIIISVHSFTPQLKGRAPRPWEIGILSANDRRLSTPLISQLAGELSSPIGDNQPYAGHLPGDTIDQHALRQERPNVLIELRQDLIDTPAGQAKWAALLARHLELARTQADL